MDNNKNEKRKTMKGKRLQEMDTKMKNKMNSGGEEKKMGREKGREKQER